MPEARVITRLNKASFHLFIVNRKNVLKTGHENFFFSYFPFILFYDLDLFSGLIIDEFDERSVDKD
jgi:hypothetical protein